MFLVAITVYMALATEFILRFLYNRPVRKARALQEKPGAAHYLERNVKLMLFGLFFSSIAIFIRYVTSTSSLPSDQTINAGLSTVQSNSRMAGLAVSSPRSGTSVCYAAQPLGRPRC